MQPTTTSKMELSKSQGQQWPHPAWNHLGLPHLIKADHHYKRPSSIVRPWIDQALGKGGKGQLAAPCSQHLLNKKKRAGQKCSSSCRGRARASFMAVLFLAVACKTCLSNDCHDWRGIWDFWPLFLYWGPHFARTLIEGIVSQSRKFNLVPPNASWVTDCWSGSQDSDVQKKHRQGPWWDGGCSTDLVDGYEMNSGAYKGASVIRGLKCGTLLLHWWLLVRKYPETSWHSSHLSRTAIKKTSQQFLWSLRLWNISWPEKVQTKLQLQWVFNFKLNATS